MTDLTTTEAAARLTERGGTARDGGPVKADTVKRMCGRGVFPGARLVTGGPARGYWLIPRDAVERYPITPKEKDDDVYRNQQI